MSAERNDNVSSNFERSSARSIFTSLDEDRREDGYVVLSSQETPGLSSASRKDPCLIGIISTTPDLPQSLHPFFGPVLAGIKTEAYAAHCDILMPRWATHAPRSSDTPDPRAIQRCHRYGVHGLIVMGIADTDADYGLVLESELPTIFVDFDVIGERIGYVMSNNFEAMAGVIAHLHSLGRRRIAAITGMMNTRPGIDRLLGYRSGLARLGLEEREEYVVEGDFYHRTGYEQTKRLLSLSEPPDAIAAASDMCAIGAVLAIEEAGLNVPEDVAVTGFDDAPFAQLLRPPLTTVRQDAFGIGRMAAAGILRLLDDPGSPPPAVLLPTELVVRESCGIEIRRSASAGEG